MIPNFPKLIFIFSTYIVSISVALGVMIQASTTRADDSQTKEPPKHQVIACYFHRTVRCPTCKKISAYIDEAVKTGYATEVKAGNVKMIMVDFQDEKNKEAVEAYKITGPTLVIMDLHDGEVTSWKPAPKVWSLVGKKDDFFKYVKNEIQIYLDEKKTASR